jgi:hypothetical protein
MLGKVKGGARVNDAQRCRMNAAECLSAAERCDPAYRSLTLAIAASWLSLARLRRHGRTSRNLEQSTVRSANPAASPISTPTCSRSDYRVSGAGGNFPPTSMGATHDRQQYCFHHGRLCVVRRHLAVHLRIVCDWVGPNRGSGRGTGRPRQAGQASTTAKRPDRRPLGLKRRSVAQFSGSAFNS